MQRILKYLLVFCLLSGCVRENKPEGILTEAEMVHVLMQMYLAEERLAKIPISYDSVSQLVPQFRNKIFNRVGIHDSVYMKSMEYYMAHPKRLEYIYTAVVDSLSLREQSKPNEYTQYASPQ